jgi:hypothetical protein
MIHKVGKLRGDKVAYKDGIGYCVWHPMPDDDGLEDCGLCFDFVAIDDLIALLGILREAPAEEFKEVARDEEDEYGGPTQEYTVDEK